VREAWSDHERGALSTTKCAAREGVAAGEW